jgi:hypothetical protein
VFLVVGVRFVISEIEMKSGILLMLCIPQFEKPWNKEKAKIFLKNVLVTTNSWIIRDFIS